MISAERREGETLPLLMFRSESNTFEFSIRTDALGPVPKSTALLSSFKFTICLVEVRDKYLFSLYFTIDCEDENESLFPDIKL